MKSKDKVESMSLFVSGARHAVHKLTESISLKKYLGSVFFRTAHMNKSPMEKM